jgi:hypothetical protein
MLGVEIEFDDNQIPLKTSSYMLPKAKTPRANAGFFQFQMVARGRIEPLTQEFSILCSTD